MIKIVISLLLIIEGTRAIPGCPPVQCEDLPFPIQFPESNEDLQKICPPLIESIKCKIRFVEGCEHIDAEEVKIGYRVLSTVKEICSEDTLLHAAIVDNLKCFSEFVHDDTIHCLMEEGPYANEHVQNFAEALANEGIISLPNNENDTTLHQCIEKLFFFACYSQKIENKCGTVAMEAYVKIVQSVGPGVFGISCEETFDQLPAVIDLRNLATDITEEVKKRK